MNLPLQPIAIAIADDDEDDRLLIKEAFEQCEINNELQFVEDGQQLIDFLRREGDYADMTARAYPGLILLDLNMPRMNGHEVLRELRADPSLCRLPVVILTTSEAEEDIVRSYGLGVNSFITKPVTFDELVSTVAALRDYWGELVALPPECASDSNASKDGTHANLGTPASD